MKKSTDVIIIGAGLTGLALGVKLKKENINFVILEKSKYPGGVISTGEENGFVYECGPNTGVYSSPELVSLFDDLDGLCELETADRTAAKRYIWKKGKWRAMPSGLLSAIGTPLFSLHDKFRILGEPFRKPGNDPHESLADLVRRRMGQSFLDYAINPFIAGVYAGDPEKLITKFALPKLYKLEQKYGSFIRGAIKKAKEPKTELERRATREVFSVKGGLQNLIKAMEEYTGKENILLNCTQTSVNFKGGKYLCSTVAGGSEHEFECDSVVTTTGSESLESLLPFVDSEKLNTIINLNHAKIIQLAAGYKVWDGHKLDAFGGLVPEKEKRKVLGILFPSAIFSGRAPEGGALLSVFMGGSRNPEIFEMEDDEIVRLARIELERMMHIKREPDLLRLFRYEKAIPQYELSSERRFETINKLQAEYPGLFIAGNIIDGIGMADRVKQAGQIAEIIAEKY